jgi:hypothetical protein
MSPATHTAPATGPTGPRTEEGKKKSALNATRHGLTSRVVVMPWEDMDAYMRFCAELMTDLAPETPVERQYAQTFCDTQWRLNRMRSIEDSMFALGHYEEAGRIEVNHPQVHAALTSARVFRDDSKTFANLSLYEQRLQRTLEKSLKQLHALQAERRARARATALQQNESEATATTQAEAETQAPAEAPAPKEFVFSTAEIGPEIHGRQTAANAETVRKCDLNAEDSTGFDLGRAA